MTALDEYYLTVTPNLSMPRARILCRKCALVGKDYEMISWPISQEISVAEVFDSILEHDIKEHS